MTLEEQAKAYQGFFYQSEAGKQFIQAVTNMEVGHIRTAQSGKDIYELSQSAGNREVLKHIDTVISSVAHPER